MLDVTIAAAARKVIDLRRNPAVRGMAGVFGLRITITALNFALISLAASALGVTAFGSYSILFSAAGLVSIIATAGQQILLMRSWNEYSSAGEIGLLKGALIFGGLICLSGSVIVALPFYAWFAMTHGTMIAASVTLYLISLSFLLTTSHLVRTAIGVGMGDGFGNLLLVIPPILYLLFCLESATPADLGLVFLLMAAGAICCLAIHSVALFRIIRRRFPGFRSEKAIYNLPLWRQRTLKLWLSNSLEAANQYIDVLIIGTLMSPAIAGGYFVISRLANAFAMATDAIHMFSTRHIPDLYYRRQYAQLGKLLDTVAGVILAVIAAGLIFIACAGPWILMIFSEAYVPYYGALMLLSFGMAAVAAAGPSGSILMLTGHEGRYLWVTSATVLLRMIGFLALIPYFHIMGAVIATTLSFMFMAILLRNSAITFAKIDGSVLRLVPKYWRQRTIAAAE